MFALHKKNDNMEYVFGISDLRDMIEALEARVMKVSDENKRLKGDIHKLEMRTFQLENVLEAPKLALMLESTNVVKREARTEAYRYAIKTIEEDIYEGIIVSKVTQLHVIDLMIEFLADEGTHEKAATLRQWLRRSAQQGLPLTIPQPEGI